MTSPSDPPPPAAVPVAIPLVNPTPPAVAPAPAGNTVDVTRVPADAPPAETPADALLAAHDAVPPLDGATPSAGPAAATSAEASGATGVTPPVMTPTPAAALPFSTDAAAPTTPLGRSAGWGFAAADPFGIPAPSTRELLSKGAAGGLLPFAHPNPTTARRELVLTAAGSAVAAIAATSARGTAERRSVVHRGGGTPKPPSGPPGDSGAGAVAGGPGGVASGVWCALLIGFVLRLAVGLRRHRICLSLPAPSGVVLLLHRPG
jgi:hypothetical protein